jgi:hypothetical protein
MPRGLTGVFITKTEPMSDAARVLRSGDVLTSFNGARLRALRAAQRRAALRAVWCGAGGGGPRVACLPRSTCSATLNLQCHAQPAVPRSTCSATLNLQCHAQPPATPHPNPHAPTHARARTHTRHAGVDVADDGTFLFREAVRINFGHLVAQQFDGDVVTVRRAAWRLARVPGPARADVCGRATLPRAPLVPRAAAPLTTPHRHATPAAATPTRTPAAQGMARRRAAHAARQGLHAAAAGAQPQPRREARVLHLCRHAPRAVCCCLDAPAWPAADACACLQPAANSKHTRHTTAYTHATRQHAHAGMVFTPLTSWYLRRCVLCVCMCVRVCACVCVSQLLLWRLWRLRPPVAWLVCTVPAS